MISFFADRISGVRLGAILENFLTTVCAGIILSNLRSLGSCIRLSTAVVLLSAILSYESHIGSWFGRRHSFGEVFRFSCGLEDSVTSFGVLRAILT